MNNDLKLVQSVVLMKGLDSCVVLHQFDNGDGVMFYQIAIDIESDTGAISSMNLPCEGDFNPADVGLALIKLA